MRTLVPGALGALLLPVLLASSAGAANDQDARFVEHTTVYTCDAGPLGEGDVELAVRFPLPKRMVAGTKLSVRTMDFTIVVPEDMTQRLRDLGVESVSGESDDATYRIGPKTRDIRDLEIPTADVPDEGYMVLTAQGTAQAVRMTRIDTYPVKLPEAFTATLDGEGEIDASANLACVLAEGAVAKITKIQVVPATA